MQISESCTRQNIRRLPIYLPMFKHSYPYASATHKSDFDVSYTAYKAWLQERLTVHRDYEWERVAFTIYHKTGHSSYPTGIAFANHADAVAFKLAFGL